MALAWCGSITAFCQYPLGNPKAIVLDIKLDQDRNLVIANLGGSIEVWNYETKEFVKRWQVSGIVAIDYKDGRLAGVSASGSVVVWDIERAAAIVEQPLVNAPLIAVAWLGENHVVVAGEAGAVLKVDATSGEVVSKAIHKTHTTALAVVNDQLMTGDEKGIISFYDGDSMNLLASVRSHRKMIRKIVPLDSAQSFYTASDDGIVRKWDVTDRKVVWSRRIGGWLTAADVVDFRRSPNQGLIVVGRKSGELRVMSGVTSYTRNVNAMVNAVEFIRAPLPNLVVAVGTHGAGIQLWQAIEMKLHK